MTETSGHRPVKTVETAFEVLDAVKRLDGAGVTEIAGDVGLAKSTAHRHVRTLHDRGLVVRDGDGYRLSTWFLDYGIHARRRHGLFDVVKPKVDELAEETDEKVWSVTEEHGKGVHLYGATGRHSVRTHARVGKITHLHQFAAGKCIMANLSAERIREIIDEHGLPASTEATITDREELLDHLETVRERGYAFNREEAVSGVHAVGVPIKDPAGEAIGAVSVAGPANRLKGDLLTEELPELLLGAANEVEVNLAHV